MQEASHDRKGGGLPQHCSGVPAPRACCMRYTRAVTNEVCHCRLVCAAGAPGFDAKASSGVPAMHVVSERPTGAAARRARVQGDAATASGVDKGVHTVREVLGRGTRRVNPPGRLLLVRDCSLRATQTRERARVSRSPHLEGDIFRLFRLAVLQDEVHLLPGLGVSLQRLDGLARLSALHSHTADEEGVGERTGASRDVHKGTAGPHSWRGHGV